MDETTRKFLSEIYQLNKENNHLLKKIDRRQRLSFYWRIFITTIAIASALGLYYYAQPLVDQAINFYGEIEKNVNQLENFPEQIKNFIIPKN